MSDIVAEIREVDLVSILGKLTLGDGISGLGLHTPGEITYDP